MGKSTMRLVGGDEVEGVLAAAVVPGDVLAFGEGDHVYADAWVVDATPGAVDDRVFRASGRRRGRTR